MMDRRVNWMGALLGLAVVCGAKDIAKEQLPAAVRDAARKACPEGWIGGVSVETQKGTRVYEVEMEMGGEDCKLEIAADGTILEKKDCPSGLSPTFWSFEKDRRGALPKGWKVAETAGKGTPATWKVVEDADHSGQSVAIVANENSGGTFNLLLAENTCFQDLEISVMVKAVAGKEDQGGGPVWRAKDADNYYICRWNPLEDNLRLYYVKEGRRRQIASATVKADPSVWHEIEVEQEGTRIEVEFDGEEMIGVSDTTFAEPGMVGLWVKADGQTRFDQVGVEKK